MTNEHDWDTLQARWHAESESAQTDEPEVLTFDEVDGNGVLTFGSGRAGVLDGWPVFRLRHRHPTEPAPVLREAELLLVVRVVAEEADRSEFRRWLDEEHCRLQVTLPGVHWYLGYEEDGDRHSFLNLWSIDAPEIVDGGEWARVRDTPWWARVSHVPEGADRGVYRRRT